MLVVLSFHATNAAPKFCVYFLSCQIVGNEAIEQSSIAYLYSIAYISPTAASATFIAFGLRFYPKRLTMNAS